MGKGQQCTATSSLKMARKPVEVGVIGAGIIGMSSAYRLQAELPGVKVTVVTKDFSPDLTSDGAAGIWELYDFFNTDPVEIKGWAIETYEYLKRMALSPSSINAGVSLLKLIDLSQEKREKPWYAHQVDHFRRMSQHEIDRFDERCADGFCYTSMTCEPKIYLPWIMNKFKDVGGVVERETVSDLSQFCKRFDLVVNCTGLMASQLANDTSMYPIRGQLIKVTGVDILNAVVTDSHCIIIPGRDMTTLGGTFDYGEYRTEIDSEIKADIMEGCCKMEPSLKKATIVMDWCGLRPARKEGVRLEVDGSYHSTTKVIHNYGHAGVGITLHWGCAGHVLHLARQCLGIQPSAKL